MYFDFINLLCLIVEGLEVGNLSSFFIFKVTHRLKLEIYKLNLISYWITMKRKIDGHAYMSRVADFEEMQVAVVINPAHS